MRAAALWMTGWCLASALLVACDSRSLSATGQGTPSPASSNAASTPDDIDATLQPAPAVAQAVGAGGATVTSDDGLATVTLPAGAVTDSATISIDDVAQGRLPGSLWAFDSNGYDLGPDGNFAQPVTVTIRADVLPVAGNRLVLGYLVGERTWVPIGSSVFDANTLAVSASVSHFTIYAVLAVRSDGTGCAAWADANAFCGSGGCATGTNRCGPDSSGSTFAVIGTVSGLVNGASVALYDRSELVSTLGYPATRFGLGTQFSKGQSYNLSVVPSAGLRCALPNAAGTIVDANVSLSLTCSVAVNFVNRQSAAMVQGQPDFVTVTANAPAQNLFRLPSGPVFLADNGKLLVPDTDDLRILGFDAVPSQSRASASFVLSQNDFVSRNAWDHNVPSVNGVYPAGIAANANYLVAADPVTNRVAIFHPFPTTNNPNLTAALGQVNTVTGGNFTCGPTSFDTPWGVLLSNEKLLVSDVYNHRVLIWNRVPLVSGTPPDLVLGQPDFVTCNHPGAVSPLTLAQPMGLWGDGNRLLVVDRDSSRVLVWNTFPTVNQQPADAFLGQGDFYSNNANTDPNAGLQFPSSVTSDGNLVIVAEPLRNRVSVWDGWHNVQGPPSIVTVLGQADASGVACNQNSTPGPATLCAADGVALVGTQLWVTDRNNSRVLVFDSM